MKLVLESTPLGEDKDVKEAYKDSVTRIAAKLHHSEPLTPEEQLFAADNPDEIQAALNAEDRYENQQREWQESEVENFLEQQERHRYLPENVPEEIIPQAPAPRSSVGDTAEQEDMLTYFRGSSLWMAFRRSIKLFGKGGIYDKQTDVALLAAIAALCPIVSVNIGTQQLSPLRINLALLWHSGVGKDELGDAIAKLIRSHGARVELLDTSHPAQYVGKRGEPYNIVVFEPPAMEEVAKRTKSKKVEMTEADLETMPESERKKIYKQVMDAIRKAAKKAKSKRQMGHRTESDEEDLFGGLFGQKTKEPVDDEEDKPGPEEESSPAPAPVEEPVPEPWGEHTVYRYKKGRAGADFAYSTERGNIFTNVTSEDIWILRAKERTALNNWDTNWVEYRLIDERIGMRYCSTVEELSGFQPSVPIPKQVRDEGSLRRWTFMPEPVVSVEQRQEARLRRDKYSTGFGPHDRAAGDAEKDDAGAAYSLRILVAYIGGTPWNKFVLEARERDSKPVADRRAYLRRCKELLDRLETRPAYTPAEYTILQDALDLDNCWYWSWRKPLTLIPQLEFTEAATDKMAAIREEWYKANRDQQPGPEWEQYYGFTGQDTFTRLAALTAVYGYITGLAEGDQLMPKTNVADDGRWFLFVDEVHVELAAKWWTWLMEESVNQFARLEGSKDQTLDEVKFCLQWYKDHPGGDSRDMLAAAYTQFSILLKPKQRAWRRRYWEGLVVNRRLVKRKTRYIYEPTPAGATVLAPTISDEEAVESP